MLCKAQAWRVSLVSYLRSFVNQHKHCFLDEGRSREKEKFLHSDRKYMMLSLGEKKLTERERFLSAFLNIQGMRWSHVVSNADSLAELNRYKEVCLIPDRWVWVEPVTAENMTCPQGLEEEWDAG